MSPEKNLRLVFRPNLLIYCDMELFKNENEKFLFFLPTSYIKQTSMARSMKEKGTFLMVSTHGFYLLNSKAKISTPDFTEPSKQLRLVGDPLLFTNLLRVDVGLGRQSLTFHFGTFGSKAISDLVDSFVFLFRDSRICTELLDKLDSFLGQQKKPTQVEPLKLFPSNKTERKGDIEDILDSNSMVFQNPFFHNEGESDDDDEYQKEDLPSQNTLFNYDLFESLEMLRTQVIKFDLQMEKHLLDYSLVFRTSMKNAKFACSIVTIPSWVYLCEGFD